MNKHIVGLIGLLVGAVVLTITGFIMDAMLKAIPHTSQRPQPKEVHAVLVPEKLPPSQ